MKLIINNIEIELSNGTDIARTLQVNDIVSFSNRQANYTNTFKLPKTAKNIKAFALLGINNTNSSVPYQRNETYLYSKSGECVVYKGWAVINSTDNTFNINVYDGNIDLYKAIENTTLAELPLTEINHTKTLDTVVDSFTNNGDYKYILADYNGNMIYGGNKINIDYLVPSANVPYLWDKIFDFYGFTYSGNVFNTFAFQNLWLTFAKGVFENTTEEAMLLANELRSEPDSPGLFEYQRFMKVENFPPTNNFLSIISNKHFQIDYTQEGTFKVRVYGNFRITGLNYTTELWIGKNSSGIGDANNVTPLVKIIDGLQAGQDFIYIDAEANLYLQAFDSLCVIAITPTTDIPRKYIGSIVRDDLTPLVLDIKRTEGQNVDFNTSFIDFKTTDFLNEVVNRFGLSMFKDKYTNHYTFKTLTELLQDNEVVDWSADKSKFVSVNSESYIYGSYARQNNLKYKYNDQESDYYNGSLSINNVNLKDSTDIFKSNIYSPEKLTTNVLGKETNVYKFWEKEPKDDGATTYKSLDKRFYLMRSDDYIFPSSRTIGSESLLNETTIVSAPFESFYKLPFSDIIQDYYLNINQILNQSKLEQHDIYLTENDIVNIDFSKLYWINELSSYYILNKIRNFRGNGITKCEMIKVDYAPPIQNGLNDIDFLIRPAPGEDDPATMLIRFSNWVSGGTIDYYLDSNPAVTLQYAPTGTFNVLGAQFEIARSYPPISHDIYIKNNGNTTLTKSFII